MRLAASASAMIREALAALCSSIQNRCRIEVFVQHGGFRGGWRQSSSRTVDSSFSVSATWSQGHRGHGECLGRRSKLLLLKVGRSSPLSRHDTKSGPIRMTSRLVTAGRRLGSWWRRGAKPAPSLRLTINPRFATDRQSPSLVSTAWFIGNCQFNQTDGFEMLQTLFGDTA